MPAPTAVPHAVRLVGRGPTENGPSWAELLVLGTHDLERWRAVAGGTALVVTDKPEGLSVKGDLSALDRLGESLPGEAELFKQAVRSLRLGPQPIRLGSAHWSFRQRTRLLGVINVTPDSFSGDGIDGSPAAALDLAARMVADGADAIDVGGESSRPGHQPVSAEEELERVVPAVQRIASALSIPVFVDTWKARVADAALSAGAVCVNDIWGLRRDPEMARVVAAHGAALVAMHNREGVEYQDLVGEVLDGLRESLRLAEAAGIPRSQLLLDPGIGFGKTPAQSLEVLGQVEQLRLLGQPILVGTSRKSLVGWLLGNRPVEGRLVGTAATVVWSAWMGIEVVRVHDVAAMHDAITVASRLAHVTGRVLG